MKQILIDELKKFFKMNKEDNLIKLEKDSKVKAISGLSTLIKGLNDPITSPKEIVQQVEDVIVCISLKNKNATDLERSLKSILESYQEKLENGEIEFEGKSGSYRM
jgi:undecaprenyl pyrophosphate synthase